MTDTKLQKQADKINNIIQAKDSSPKYKAVSGKRSILFKSANNNRIVTHKNRIINYFNLIGLDYNKTMSETLQTLNSDKTYNQKTNTKKTFNKGGEIKQATKTVSLNISDYPTQFSLNKAIEKLIEEKGDNHINYTQEEKDFIPKFTGYGGLYDEMINEVDSSEFDEKFLYEYYTPEQLIEKMIGLAYNYGYKEGQPWLEPAAGIGRFLRHFSKNTPVTTYEINPVSNKILKILHPHGNHILGNFEQAFMTGRKFRTPVKNKVKDLPKYDLVIGNPPYGKYSGKYSKIEAPHTKATTFVDYFITRGLDLLNKDGLLIYVIGAEPSNGAKMWLKQPMTPAKKIIAEKAELIDAYRLPQGIFDKTDVLSDIVVFRKK